MTPDKKVDNYEKWCEEWERRFLTLDIQELKKKLPELSETEDYLLLSHFHREYGIDKKTGKILAMDHGKVPLNTRFNIYTLLWYCKPDAALLDDWVPFRSLKDASPFGPAFQKSVIQVFARTFSGHLEELEQAFLALGGRKLSHSDLGYEIDSFQCIPIRFLFWEGDEEFPAQANLLFDRSAVDFIHVESVVTIASEGLARLSELTGLPLAGSSFVQR